MHPNGPGSSSGVPPVNPQVSYTYFWGNGDPAPQPTNDHVGASITLSADPNTFSNADPYSYFHTQFNPNSWDLTAGAEQVFNSGVMDIDQPWERESMSFALPILPSVATFIAGTSAQNVPTHGLDVVSPLTRRYQEYGSSGAIEHLHSTSSERLATHYSYPTLSAIESAGPARQHVSRLSRFYDPRSA